jgi:hypothetical protein
MTENSGTGPWGKVVVSRLYGFRKIAIYSNGYIQINGNTAEKLLAISGNADSVVSKTGLGRATGALFTFGLNLLLTPNLRGRMILSIYTDQDTYVYNDPAMPHLLGVLQELVTVGTSVINASQSGTHTPLVTPAEAVLESKAKITPIAASNTEGGLLGRLNLFGALKSSKTGELKALKQSLEKHEISPAEYLAKKDKLLGAARTAQPKSGENDSEVLEVVGNQLGELKKLLDSGLLSEAEFHDLKDRALGSQRKDL